MNAVLAMLLGLAAASAGAQGFSSSSTAPAPDANPFLTGSAARAAGQVPPSSWSSTAVPETVAESTPTTMSTSSAGAADAAPPATTESGLGAGEAVSVPAPDAPGSTNPFLTGSAAEAAATEAAAAANPFLTPTAARAVAKGHVGGIDAAHAGGAARSLPVPAAGAPPAGATSGGGTDATLPFGASYDVAVAGPARAREPADHILVKKSERRLYLLHRGRIIAEYPIKLGLNPTGPKRYEGDYRTPEGSYQLVRRNSNSEYFLALEVSYPNEGDLERARELGLPPGGLIMIHGQPNAPSKPANYYASNDWTNGCIALSNPDMVDVWLRTDLGTPIEIRP